MYKSTFDEPSFRKNHRSKHCSADNYTGRSQPLHTLNSRRGEDVILTRFLERCESVETQHESPAARGLYLQWAISASPANVHSTASMVPMFLASSSTRILCFCLSYSPPGCPRARQKLTTMLRPGFRRLLRRLGRSVADE